MRILKDFKCRVFGSADSKGVTHAFSVSADCKGVSEKQVADRKLFGRKERTGDLMPWGILMNSKRWESCAGQLVRT